jgi:hypothetical protein
MFEFLFKRPGDKPGDKPAGQEPQAEHAASGGSGSATTPQRALQGERLSQIGGDEAAAVEFILQCEFSELRLAAAEFVHSPEPLERVHTAMRNTDRRVAKLMQSRLDAHRHREAERRRGETTLEQARALLRDELLTPNHVADLDRKWSVISAPELQEDFGTVRAALGQRLEAQVQLQRSMIDRLAGLRRLPAEAVSAAELAARLDALAQEQAQALQAPEHPSLPRGLVAEFGLEHQKLQANLHEIETSQAALAAREAFLAFQQDKPAAELNADALRKEWQRLPHAPQAAHAEAAAELQRRFDALLATVPQPEPRKPREPKEPRAAQAAADAGKPREQGKPKGADQHFLDTMDAMEAALQQGSLGTAAELDKSLKEARDKGMRLTPAQSDRLAHVRAELKRLSDWARWGGNVSREELIKSVEALPTQNLAMSELAKKVGSMRERWKALDSLSGAAPKSLWERFDAACTGAYAPAAAHFRHLADERHANAARAQAVVDEANGEIARLRSGEVEWKHVAGTVQRLRLAWSHLGAIDRKEKKRLDAMFTDALNTLQGPLEEQRKGEMAEREELIELAAAIDPHDRNALDTMRALQQRWQDHARALPLERKSEQALWQRFRAVCDDVFQRRKDSMHEADIERRAHEAAKEAISARLEAAAPDLTPAAAAKLLREARPNGRRSARCRAPMKAGSRSATTPPWRRCSTTSRPPGAPPAWPRPASCATSCAWCGPGTGRRRRWRGARRRLGSALERLAAAGRRDRAHLAHPLRDRAARPAGRPRRLCPAAETQPRHAAARPAAGGDPRRHRQRPRVRARALEIAGGGAAVVAKVRPQRRPEGRPEGWAWRERRPAARTGCAAGPGRRPHRVAHRAAVHAPGPGE